MPRNVSPNHEGGQFLSFNTNPLNPAKKKLYLLQIGHRAHLSRSRLQRLKRSLSVRVAVSARPTEILSRAVNRSVAFRWPNGDHCWHQSWTRKDMKIRAHRMRSADSSIIPSQICLTNTQSSPSKAQSPIFTSVRGEMSERVGRCR